MSRLNPICRLCSAAISTLVALALAPAAAAESDPSIRCSALTGQRLSTGRIETAQYVAAGSRLFMEVQEGILAPLNALTAPRGFCRVRVYLRPTKDSDILVEAWLPDTWNGKLYAVGGGGFSGGYATAPLTLREPLAEGYAGLSTDVGHPAGETAQWAYGHREKLIDYAYRGNHLAAVTAKEAIRSLYGRSASRAYFHGCSNGGRDALMEVSRFPNDYDGVIAGAPASSWTALMTNFMATRKAMFGSNGVTEIGKKLTVINTTVMAKCDALDGVKDGIIEVPGNCRFDPTELQCKPNVGDEANCLTPNEVAAARTIYGGTALGNGKQIMPGFAVGGETSGWNEWITSDKPMQSGLATEYFRWMVYGQANWDVHQFDTDRDYALAQQRTGFLNSDNPNIRAFVRRGGKLILYHGWNDAAIPPQWTVQYFDAARRRSDPTGQSTRLFMAPGMGHCFGGPGPNKFDMLPDLDAWVEKGAAPERVIATKYPNDLHALIGMPQKPIRTRPLCAWPKIARYKGAGSIDDAASFSCEMPL
jgi:hypothetical protein